MGSYIPLSKIFRMSLQKKEGFGSIVGYGTRRPKSFNLFLLPDSLKYGRLDPDSKRSQVLDLITKLRFVVSSLDSRTISDNKKHVSR